MVKKLIFLSLLLMDFACYSQSSIEFSLGAGITAVDIETLVEKTEISGTTAEDWSLLNIGVSGQYFFTTFGTVAFGTELMYHYLYWYQVRVPFGSTPINREYSVSAFRITPIFRFGQTNIFNFDVGPEINFSDGVSIGLLASANFNIPVTEKVIVPIKFRLDFMNQEVLAIPISLHAGVRVKL